MPVSINGFQSHYNNAGPGKGLALYFREDTFMPSIDITEDKMQLSKLVSPKLEAIIIYRSEQGHLTQLRDHLEKLITPNRTTIICGDFNFCYLANRGNMVTKFLENLGFQQLVHEATHIKGRHLDQFYIKLEGNTLDMLPVFRYSPYYSDHDAICVSMNMNDDLITSPSSNSEQ